MKTKVLFIVLIILLCSSFAGCVAKEEQKTGNDCPEIILNEYFGVFMGGRVVLDLETMKEKKITDDPPLVIGTEYNDKSLYDAFQLPENWETSPTRSSYTFQKGQEKGQNVNYYYGHMRIRKPAPVSEEGVVGEEREIKINLVLEPTGEKIIVPDDEIPQTTTTFGQKVNEWAVYYYQKIKLHAHECET